MILKRFLFTMTTMTNVVMASHAEAGTVQKINKVKKMLLVEMDPSETVKKGDSICIFADDGQKIGCGTAKSVKAQKVKVYLKSKKKLAKIVEGMRAAPNDTVDSDGSESSSASNAPAAHKMRVMGFYSAALMTTATYDNFMYDSKSAPSSLWQTSGTVNQSLLGFGLQIAIPVKKIFINPGFRYRIFRAFEGENNYATDRNPYVTTQSNASEIGLFADAQFLNKAMGTKLILDGAAGLDLAMSSVSFVAQKKDDTGKVPDLELATAKSTLNVISLRLNGGLGINLTPKFGLRGGMVLFLPLFATGGDPVGKFAGGDESKGVPDPGKDIKEKLAHKKASIGAEVTIGAFVGF